MSVQCRFLGSAGTNLELRITFLIVFRVFTDPLIQRIDEIGKTQKISICKTIRSFCRLGSGGGGWGGGRRQQTRNAKGSRWAASGAAGRSQVSGDVRLWASGRGGGGFFHELWLVF